MSLAVVNKLRARSNTVGRPTPPTLVSNSPLPCATLARKIKAKPADPRVLRALHRSDSMDMYQLGPVIGHGRFGKVRRATHRLTGQVVAMKVYNKAQVKHDDHIQLIRKEVDIMKEIDHPNVVRLYEILETPEYILIAMELCEGEDLGKYIARRTRVNEGIARAIFTQLVDSISYLHRQNIIHRDIKPDNIFIQDSVTPPIVKLVDFGLGSRDPDHSKKLSAFCGTPAFMAPEIIFQEAYDGKPVDAWSLGVVLYMMTVGKIPFEAKSTDALYKKVLVGTFDLPATLSSELRDLLQAILVVDANERMRVEHIRHHAWLGMENQSSVSSEVSSSLFVADAATHKDILTEMDGYGLNRMQLHDDLASKTYNASTTWYRLLHLRRLKTRKAACSNAEPNASAILSSVDFSRFLQDRIAQVKTVGS
ncbi:CAMK/CAMKL/AMPK protein kinase [Aphanomyces invadans]|uniref:non-specific serine/threonine protein kinase n=1 Tax=Aphanomyces invadans TaxID=157072 RepID=A0A024TNH8_9STRA|nr:CAMK/CAMKL/AMPK protein kinase [Aphanomyces invadans]ETV95191.1 CAMK/CAMKL/AMPK protein kinase [Aphanomyces invadans]|eukprot:XP_008876364.1 CAMK/CAMKL/AMPK protein kinase [Aphanomyces invadans]